MTNINENAESSETQKRQILEWLESGHSITPADARRLFNCDRLSARIWDLRNDEDNPVEIKTELVKDLRTGKRFAKYSMV